MNYTEYRKSFIAKCEKHNYPPHIVENCLDYARTLLSKELPVIYNTTHLSNSVGYTKSYLKRAAKYSTFFYKDYSIPKKTGGTREISEPLTSLKEIQNWILHNILYKIKVSRYAKAYIKNRSIINHVKYHDNQEYVLTLDIKNFFPSLAFDTIKSTFHSFGYNDIVSDLLAKLCMRDSVLPQGAPTSPYLTNIIMYGFDETTGKEIRDKGLHYTRYADDIAISGNINDKDEIIKSISDKLEILGLELKPEKTKFMRQSERQIVTGIVVNQKIQVPRKLRRKLRQSMFYISKHGLDDHMKKVSIKKKNYLRHLLGTANYISFINPKDEEVRDYIKELHKLLE